jgi:hypothetical protein
MLTSQKDNKPHTQRSQPQTPVRPIPTLAPRCIGTTAASQTPGNQTNSKQNFKSQNQI